MPPPEAIRPLDQRGWGHAFWFDGDGAAGDFLVSELGFTDFGPARPAQPAIPDHIWVVGSAIVGGAFTNTNDESVVTYLSSLGYRVTRQDASWWPGDGTRAPLKTQCDVAIVTAETFPSYGAFPYTDVKCTVANAAPILSLNNYSGNAHQWWTVAGANVSGDIWEVRSVAGPTWTAGYAVNDTFDIGTSVFGELGTGFSTGAFAILRSGSLDLAQVFPSGSTNRESNVTTARMALLPVFSPGLNKFDSAAGQDVIRNILTWLKGSVSATATPARVALTSATPSPTPGASAAAAAALVPVTVATPVPTPSTSVTAGASPVGLTLGVGAPSLAASASPASTAVALVLGLPAPSVLTGVIADALTVGLALSVLGPVAAISGTATPGVVALTLALPSPAASAAQMAEPLSVGLVLSLPGPTLGIGASVAPGVTALTLAIGAAVVRADALSAATVVQVVLALTSPTFTVSSTAAAEVVALLLNIRSAIGADLTPGVFAFSPEPTGTLTTAEIVQGALVSAEASILVTTIT